MTRASTRFLCLFFVAGLLPAPWVRAGDGRVAVQTAQPGCATQSGVYVDCGNGTVTDNRTGLVWLENADCYGTLNWYEAVGLVANLSDIPDGSVAEDDDCGLSDGSSPGDWRMPSAAEWEAMTADAKGLDGDPDCIAAPPAITNDTGQACWVNGPSSFANVAAAVYWSSPSTSFPTVAWSQSLTAGSLNFGLKTSSFRLWPIRSGGQ